MESEQESELVDWITEAGGDIVSIEEKNEIDYLITGRASERMGCEQYKIFLTLADFPHNTWWYIGALPKDLDFIPKMLRFSFDTLK